MFSVRVAFVCGALVAATAVGATGFLTGPEVAGAERQPLGEGAFYVQSSDSETSCVIRKLPEAGTLAHLAVEPSCDAVVPGLTQMQFWRDLEDGSVAFSADGGAPMVSFAVADGVAYESFAPRSPVISLVSADAE